MVREGANKAKRGSDRARGKRLRLVFSCLLAQQTLLMLDY